MSIAWDHGIFPFALSLPLKNTIVERDQTTGKISTKRNSRNDDQPRLALPRLTTVWNLVFDPSGARSSSIFVFLCIEIRWPEIFSWFFYPIVFLVGRTTLGLILVLFAPAIAVRFHPLEISPKADSPEYDETRILKVGIQLLAVYALLLAVQSGAGVLLGLLSNFSSLGGMFNSSETLYLQSLLTCGLNLAFAALLLMWSDQVIEFVAKIRYVAERDAYEPPLLDE